MNRSYRLWFSLGAGMFTGLLLLVILFQLMGFTLKNTVVMETCQGEYVKYNSFDPYCVSIIKQSQPLSSNYIVMVSRRGDKEYGHVINYIDPTETSEENMRKTRVIWSSEGIEMTFPAGHKLYIPKDKFTGGR